MNTQQINEVAAAVAAILQSKKPAKKARKTSGPRLKGTTDERKAAFAEAVLEAFEAAGYGKVTLNEDVLSYGKWIERGFKVRKGEKAIRIKTKFHRRGQGLPLFHHSQVEKI